jgi:hypothetical protein
MADKRISQLVERTDIANNDVVPIVASGATTTNKATISSIQEFMQENLDLGVTSVGITLGTTGTDVNVTGSPITTSGNITINFPTASATNRGLLSSADWTTFNNKQAAGNYVTLDTTQSITATKSFITGGGGNTLTVSQTSGSGIALNITKFGNGEGLKVEKFSGTGNAATIIGGLLSTEGISSTAPSNAISLLLNGRLADNVGIIAFGANTGGGQYNFIQASPTSLIVGSRGNTPLEFHTNVNGGGGPRMTIAGSGGVTFTNGITTTSAVLTSVLQGVNANFSGLIETSDSVRIGTTASVKHSNTGFTLSGYNNIHGNIDGFVVQNQTKGFRINFPSNAGFTHTLPDASGTIALTSNLGAYLPLTGGTLTGALNGTSASFGGLLTINVPTDDTTVGIFHAGGGTPNRGLKISTFVSTNNNAGVRLDAQTLVGGARLALATAGVDRLTIDSTGAATFSSSVTAAGLTLSSASTPLLEIIDTTNSKSLLFGADDNNTFIRSSTSTPILFQVNGGDSALSLASTGAATFSSTIRSNNTNGLGIGDIAGYRRIQYDNSLNTFGFLNDANSLGNIDALAATFSSSVAVGAGITIGTTGTNDIVWGTAGGIKLSRTNVGPEYALSQRWTGSLAYVDIASSSQWNGGVTILPNGGGNVGIGTDSPTEGKLVIVSASNAIALALRARSDNDFAQINFLNNSGSIQNGAIGLEKVGTNGGSMYFFSKPDGGSISERMRITSGGAFKASNAGNYLNVNAAYHELRQGTANTNIAICSNTTATPFGFDIRYPSASPNGTSNSFIVCEDSTALRFEVRSNGGIANYATNNVILSDERLKKDIEPLESYWDKFKAIEIVKYKYIDQTHDDFNIGVIAQQVEAVAPEFVDVDGWGTKPELDEEGNEIISEEEPIKSIYDSDLHHATIKVLQEAMAKIEKLEIEISSLKNQIK